MGVRFKTIDDFELREKRVLIRVDLNSEIVKGKPVISDRIVQHAGTIKELVRKGAKVVVMAHQGRPGKKDFTSLKLHCKLLNKYVKVKFVPDVIGKKAVGAIKDLKPGEAILLENVRSLKDEFKPSVNNKFVKTLKPLFDIYLEDAFSISHRAQTSIVSFPKVLENGMGRVLQRELENIDTLDFQNCLFILGGAKPEDQMLLLSKKNVLTEGLVGVACLIAKGKDVGTENKDFDKSVISKLKRKAKDVETPVDFVVDENGKSKIISVKDLPTKYNIFDIGPETVKKYSEKISKAKTIFMKGPAGYVESKKFAKGTGEILKAISKAKGFSVISGGHTLTALEHVRVNKKGFGYVSLSGGALVHYIAGEKLPGLGALTKKK